MERKNSPINKAAAILLVLIASGAGLYMVRDMWLTFDSMRYAIVSQEIAAGRGLRSSMIEFYGPVPDSHGTVPFLVQAPLLPAVLAVFGAVEPGKIWPGQLLNVLCHTAITIFSWLIAKRLLGNVMAFILGLTVALSMSLLTVCHFLWSEPLFIMLILATVYFLLTARYSKHSGGWTLAAGISASAAVVTRYAGIAVLPLFIVEIGYLWKQKLTKSAAVRRIFYLALPILTTTILFAHNELISGTLNGYPLDPPGRSLISSILGVITHTLDELAIHGVSVELLSRIGLWEYRKVFLLLAGVLLIIWLGLLLHRSRLRDIFQKCLAGYDLIFLFIAGYGLLISYGLFKRLPYFEGRFFAPLVPFILILIVSLINPYSNSLGRRFFTAERNTKTVLVMVLVLCSVIWFVESGPKFFEKPDWLKRFDLTETFRWMESNVPANETVATNLPSDVSFYSGRPTLNLPSRFWDRMILPDNMSEALTERMKQTHAGYLILFIDEKGLRADYFGEFIAGLSRREPAEHYDMVFNSADGVVYKLK